MGRFTKHIALAAYGLATVGPLALGLGYSLCYSLGLAGLLGKGLTTRHWARLFGQGEALASLGYTLWLTMVAMAGVVSLALWLAWRHVDGSTRRWFFKLLYLPLVFPPLVAAFAWFHILSPGGILGRVAWHVGLIDSVGQFPRLVNDQFGLGVLWAHIFLVFPIFTLLFIEQAGKLQIKHLAETSDTLGATRRQFVRKVYIPMMLAHARPMIWLYAIFLMGCYEVPLLLGQSYPRVATVLITDHVARYNLQDIPLGHAMAVLYSVVVILLTRFFVKGKPLVA